MSKLATKLPASITAPRVRKGPSGACDIYGDGDLQDWAAVERLRTGTTWVQVQHEVDVVLGSKPIDLDKFRYHWRRKCWHWTQEQRTVRLEDVE